MSVDQLRTQVLAASLWIACQLELLFRDVHEFLRPGYVADLASGATAPGDAIMIASAFVLQLPILMVPLSIVLTGKAFARATLCAAALFLLANLAAGLGDADDKVFLVARCLVLMWLLGIGWGRSAGLATAPGSAGLATAPGSAGLATAPGSAG